MNRKCTTFSSEITFTALLNPLGNKATHKNNSMMGNYSQFVRIMVVFKKVNFHGNLFFVPDFFFDHLKEKRVATIKCGSLEWNNYS